MKIRWLMMLLAFVMLFSAAMADLEEFADFTHRHGDRTVKKVAITVDDCYEIDKVEDIIALCEQYQVKVTFFPIGKALKYADAPVWQRAVSAGCEIGNHSWGHTDLTKLSDRDNRFQMLRTQQKIDSLLEYHYPMQVLRPPLGLMSRQVAAAIEPIGYMAAVKWDVDTTDARKAFKAVENGSILLFHARKADVKSLETLIPQLLQEGYELVTVSELLELPPIATSTDLYVYDSSHADDPALLQPNQQN